VENRETSYIFSSELQIRGIFAVSQTFYAASRKRRNRCETDSWRM